MEGVGCSVRRKQVIISEWGELQITQVPITGRWPTEPM